MLPALWIALALCGVPSGGLRPAYAEGPPEKIIIPAEKFQEDANQGGTSETGLGETDRRFNFEGFRTRIDGLWFKRKALLERDLPDAAEQQIEAIQDLSREMGVSRLDAIASALVREGHECLEEGNYEGASRSLNDALRFTPDLPEAHFALAAANWRGGELGAAFGELFAGARAYLRSRTLTSAMFGNILILSILAIAGTSILISVAMLLRYHVLVRHDLAEALNANSPGRYTKDSIRLFGWILVALPLITWVAALWTPAYWLSLTFRYQNARERVISAALFILLVLSAPAARAAEILFALAADPSARLMLASTSLSYDPEQILVLEEKAAANPQDPAYKFLLGGLYARGRYFEDALAEYRTVVQLDPQSYRAFNNMGNIFLRTGQPEDAVKNYRQALELRTDFLPAYYNIYLARKELLQLREGEEALRSGQSIDPDGMSRLVDEAKTRGVGEPVDAVISRDEVFARILGEGQDHRSIAASLVSFPSILLALFFLTALLLARLFGRRHATRCVKCGQAFCHRCKISQQSPEYCAQCHQIFLRREGIAPAMMREKVSDSERFRTAQARLSRLSALVLPGMSRLLDGRTLSGTLASALWCGSLLALVLRPWLLHVAGAGAVQPFFMLTIVLGVLAAGGWMLGNFRAIRDADAPAGIWRWH